MMLVASYLNIGSGWHVMDAK